MLNKFLGGALIALLLGSTACTGVFDGSDDGVTDSDDPDDPEPKPDANVVIPPPPPDAVWKRGSLPPLFQMTPRGEYGRMAHLNADQVFVSMSDGDFAAAAVGTSLEQKMDDIVNDFAADFADEPDGVELFGQDGDRDRAATVPFRGNPTDVKLLEVNNVVRAYVPLGGGLSDPGNEVASVNTENGTVERIKVGLRPQRLALHPSGLVFVCNQYSNYISVIDADEDELLELGGELQEVKTEYFCGDLVFVPKTPGAAADDEEQLLLVINRYRHSLLVYDVKVTISVIDNNVETFSAELIKEVTGIGLNPIRITLDEQQANAYIVSNRGGDISRVAVGPLKSATAPNQVLLTNAGTAVLDAVVIADKVFMPSRMIDRGLLDRGEDVPEDVDAPPLVVEGLNGDDVEAHPGAIFDDSRSYNFEDVRNGILQYELNLSGQEFMTDESAGEPNYDNDQKIIDGASPMSIVRNKAGTRVWVAMGGTDNVQEFAVNTNDDIGLDDIDGGNFETEGHRPFQVTIDEENNRLYVVTWGGESLEVFNLQNRQRIGDPIDLGYAFPAYPATNIEEGELYYYNAEWSGNGDKSCENCHVDELITDGFGYSNGASTPTGYHQVKPNHNLMTTNGYFWTGGMNNGDYTSVAFAAQTRVNCDLIAFGFTEGPASNAAQRIGDPFAKIGTNLEGAAQQAESQQCRPEAEDPNTGLPENFADIARITAEQKLRRNARIAEDVEDILGDGRQRDHLTVSRFMDSYSVAELRLPPNPVQVLYRRGQLAPAAKASIERGEALFEQAGCDRCHDPDNDRHPFTDGENHGDGAQWTSDFIEEYQNDPRVLAIFNENQNDILTGFPQIFREGNANSNADETINVHLDPIAYFTPFCFDEDQCVEFKDPLAFAGSDQGDPNEIDTEEDRRLDLLVRVNLLDPERGFIPGNPIGQPMINTPSLRGMWAQAGILHTGYARGVIEAIAGPGHKYLEGNERGWAYSNTGKFDTHGTTSNMDRQDLLDIEQFVLAIE